ncbi:hypothetical protein KI387_029722, partial [Taxus chinensis]
IDGSLDEGETGVPMVEATAIVGITRLDAKVVASLVDGIMGGDEVVFVVDALT